MGAVVLSLPNVDHLGVLVEIALLREPHIAQRALEGLLLRVRSQVVEELTQREDRERALGASFMVFVLTLKELEKSSLQVRPQKVVNEIFLALWNMDGGTPLLKLGTMTSLIDFIRVLNLPGE